MCRFFKPINLTKASGVGCLLIPIGLMINAFKNQDINTAVIGLTWFATGSVLFGFGYLAGKNTPCQLPHLAENIEVEPSQIEGAQPELQNENQLRI